MPADSESISQSQTLLTPHVLRLVDDVLKMGKTTSSAVSRVGERIEQLDNSVNAIKEEHIVIKEKVANIEKTLETALNALREQMRADPQAEASGSHSHEVVASLEQPAKPNQNMEIKREDTSGQPMKCKVEDDALNVTSALIGTSSGVSPTQVQEQPPELPRPDPGMDIEEKNISDQRTKRKFEDDTPEITTASIDTISGTRKRPSQSLPPIETISEAVREFEETKINAGGREDAQDDNDSEEEKEVQDITQTNTDRGEDIEAESADERDELAEDYDPNLTDRDNSEDVEERMLNLKAELVFKNDKRCTACIDKGLEECKVLKTAYVELEKYVDSLLTGTAKSETRPSNSACRACHKRHATFCQLPVTREKLGPGFTKAHRAGPFPVPASAPVKPKNSTSRVLRPRKKARTLSPQFPFSSDSVE